MATLIGWGSHARDMYYVMWSNMVGLKVVAHHSELEERQGVFWIGINDPQTRYEVSKRLIETGGYCWTGGNLHARNFEGGPGSFVHPRVHVGIQVTLGHHTHINYDSSMTRTTIGHHCTISPGVTICGDVTIGNRVLVGAGATICDRVTIGSDVTIGAGAVVLPETVIPDGETWVGVPARARKPELAACWFQFNSGHICCGDHSQGLHSIRGFGGNIEHVADAPVANV